MNALPEMLQWLDRSVNGPDMSVLQRQQARISWQQQEQQQSYYDQIGMHCVPDAGAAEFQSLINGDSVFGRFANTAVKPDPGLETEWPGYGNMSGHNYFNANGVDLNCPISRTISCPPSVVATAALGEAAGSGTTRRETSLQAKMRSTIEKESFKKRKAYNNDDNKGHFQITEDGGNKEKKSKGCAEDTDSKITIDQNSNKSCMKHSDCNNKGSSNDNSKTSEVKKPDYIHVRARRGQATDSHSLAERVRREKISERMNYLQDLVPGCNKITGKAGMLDEIINYVQSLQKQVEFLSMKLANVNPRLDLNVDSLFSKEMFPACTSNFPTIGPLSDAANPAHLQCNPLQQVVTCSGLDMGTTASGFALKRTTSAPVSIPETIFNPSCYNQMQPSGTWDLELQNLYSTDLQHGRLTNYPSQLFTGSVEGSNLEMEM